jgi:hypothetical protein
MKIIRNFIVAFLFAFFVCISTANAAENTGEATFAPPQRSASRATEEASIGMLGWLIRQFSTDIPLPDEEFTSLRGLKAPPLW